MMNVWSATWSEGHSWFPVAAHRNLKSEPCIYQTPSTLITTITQYWALRVIVILFCMWNTINNLKAREYSCIDKVVLRIPSKHWRSSFFIQRPCPFQGGSHLPSSLKNFTLYFPTHIAFLGCSAFPGDFIKTSQKYGTTPSGRVMTCTKTKCLVCSWGRNKDVI